MTCLLTRLISTEYYDEMTVLLRGVLAQVLKTNDSLQMAVLTGCLRISKESIFTGLNNLRVLTVMDSAFDEYFGFTDREVRELLLYYEVPEAYGTMKEWYDRLSLWGKRGLLSLGCDKLCGGSAGESGGFS